MNDKVYYSIYDTGIRKDEVNQYKIVNLTSATEAAFTWASSHKKSKPTHGAPFDLKGFLTTSGLVK